MRGSVRGQSWRWKGIKRWRWSGVSIILESK
ncbi:hypothetical protein Golob_019355 [Gossypium lobatum]|uniref:Uncharacterized protein n=1 Tax=Gossypium lobatum TaxID=34289 RepID=A0A7J8L758_9ROSI|nr:hypothetical protein [Gossypium lobatum]